MKKLRLLNEKAKYELTRITMKKRYTLEWSSFGVQVTIYYTEYFRYFITLNPSYPKDLQDELFPLFLEIYGSHQPAEKSIYTRESFYQAVDIIEKNDFGFYAGFLGNPLFEDSDLLKKKCFEFASKFREFLEKYHLYNENYSEVSNHGLASVVYFAVFIGEPLVLNDGSPIIISYPTTLLEELWQKYSKEDWIKFLERKLKSRNPENAKLDSFDQKFLDNYKANIHLPRVLPPADNFQYYPPYDLIINSSDYEKMAIDAYRKHIRTYLKELKSALKRHGLKRYKTEDKSKIQRLVIWNNYQFEHLWEILPYIPEFEKVDLRNELQVKSAVDVLRKSFKKFEYFNLPVRPYGNKRKNKSSKKGSEYFHLE